MLVLVVLAVIWGIVLGPPALRWYADRKGGGTDSISRFHRSLHLMEPSGAPAVPPAYRLAANERVEAPGSRLPELHAKPALTLVTGDAPRPAALAFLSEQSPADFLPGVGDPGGSDRWPTERDRVRERTVRQRRRDVLSVLAGVFVFTAAVGFVPSMGFVWVVTVLDAVALAAYVAMLVHLRVQAEERAHLERIARRAPTPAFDDADGLVAVVVDGFRDDLGLGVDVGYDPDEVAVGYEDVDPVALRACRMAHPSALAIAN